MKPLIKLTGFVKSCLLLLPITFLFYPFTKLMLFLSYLNKLLVWIYGNKKKFEYREPVAFNRNYNNRSNLYKDISDNYVKDNSEIVYREFGIKTILPVFTDSILSKVFLRIGACFFEKETCSIKNHRYKIIA